MIQDLTQARADKCAPIALAILKAIANQPDLPIATGTQDTQRDYYKKFFAEVIEPILRNVPDLKVFDIRYIFSLILEPVENTKVTTIQSVESAEDAVIAFRLGIPDVNELTIGDIIKIQSEAATLKSDMSQPVDNSDGVKAEPGV
jgi:hypothetical protein